MSTPEIRPRFERDAHGSPDEVLARFRKCEDPRFVCSILGNHVQIALHEDQADLWSPWLTFELLQDEDGRTHVSGRFSSNPTFFTLYLGSVVAVALTTVGLGIVGLSQWQLGLDPWGLWALPVGGLLLLGLGAVPFIGQRLAREQLEAMHHRVNRVLDGQHEIEPELAAALAADKRAAVQLARP